MARITVTVGSKTQVLSIGPAAAIVQSVLDAQAAATAAASQAAASAATANLFAAGVTDLGLITSPAVQTFDMGSIT